MEPKVVGTFVSQKINRVRWMAHEILDAEYFVAGSWDDEVDKLTLWKYTRSIDTFAENDYLDLKHSIPVSDCVTEIKFVNSNSFVASFLDGSVKLLELSLGDLPTLKEIRVWNRLHYYKTGSLAPCNSLACFEDDVATVGDEGRLVFLSARNPRPVRILDEADSSALHCISFLKHNEVITGNLRGQMKIWDLKSRSDKPSATFKHCEKLVRVGCVVHHPTQRHAIMTGADDGSIIVWDLRQHTFPVAVLHKHEEAVSEIQFHPDLPDNLFTSSVSGDIYHWNSSETRGNLLSASDTGHEDNPWLRCDAAKHRLSIYNLMPRLPLPINGLDINRDRVVCGCDNEAIYVLTNILLT